MKLIVLAPADEARLLSLTAHEAGHAVVAAYFGLKPTAAIGGPHSGICKHDPGTPFQNAAVSWAGVAGEDICQARHPGRTLPAVTLTPQTFPDWIYGMLYGGGLDQLARYSQPDVDEIRKRPEQFETCQAALSILWERRELLDWWAARLASEFRERYRAATVRNDLERDEADCLSAV
jgi:hypothetical protein